MRSRRRLLFIAGATALLAAVASIASAREYTSPLGPFKDDPPPAQAGTAGCTDGEPVCAAQPGDSAIEFPEALTDLIRAPEDLAIDPSSGSLWFIAPDKTQTEADFLYEFKPAEAALKSYALPITPFEDLFSVITADERGHIILGYDALIVDFDPSSGAFKQFDLPSPSTHESPPTDPAGGGWVTDITIGAGRRVYATRMNVAAITEVDLETGAVREIPTPRPIGLFADIEFSQGAVWITSPTSNPSAGIDSETGRLDVDTGQYHPIPTKTVALIASSNGDIFALSQPPLSGIVALGGGLVQPLALDTDPGEVSALNEILGAGTNELALDSSGSLWITPGHHIAKVGPVGLSVELYELPTYFTSLFSKPPCLGPIADCGPGYVEVIATVSALAVAPDGDVYFSDGQGRGRIGVIHAGR